MTAESTVQPVIGRPPAARPWRNTLLTVAIAFLAGLLVMGWAMSHYGDSWFGRGGDAPQRDTSRGGGVPAEAVVPAPVYPATPPLTIDTRVADLESRLSNIDGHAREAAGNATRAEGLLIAFAARRALDRGMQLGYLEAQLRERFGPTQPRAVAMIVAASRMPVTLDDLRAGLDDAAPELLGGAADEGWWDGFRRELSNLVVVRRNDAPSPAPGERLARAKRRLEGGRVDAALAEVARMPGREKARAWIAAARRYDEARQALDTIETAAITEPRAAALAPPPVATVPPAAAAADAAVADTERAPPAG
ncbi:hypothetical protein [Sphingomonas sanxanigenens]|uniref:Inner membrane protein n=1 Tax=Sphingomonas sanxanigenens DSM 19645 = NX02 TaxID=1123269 RepID=W0AI44_9SPHN|nr:hypothetical protein [Sphingomonas sanxanigenens]AHE56786.1 hypothetical protein NX02_25910 [Sphingomonas sanxanigenens DSM 19645 = NX02]